ncbi:MAG: Zn-dependent oligopeptidase [Acidobacteria bacterium]|nr:Zn-dependent oligopeptidase [Acidobacteriota bacterium]
MSASDLLPDYTTVTPADVTEITDAAIEQSDRLVAALVGDRDDRTYANTMQPLDDLTVIMNDADGRGVFMARVHPNAEVRKAAVAAEETMAKWGNDLVMRPDVAAAIKGYAETVDAANLDGLQARNLEFWLRDLRRAGHDLGGADRDELRKLRQRLIEVQVAYRSNLDEWDDGIDMTLEDLAGLPESYIERLAPGSEPDTYRVSMAYPDYIPFVEEAERRDLRQRLQFKFWNRAAEANMPLLEEGIRLRRQIALLLGYDTWTDYSMEVKMADPSSVDDLYDSIVPGLTVRGNGELAILQDLAADDVGEAPIQAWDWAYYHTEQRKRDYGIDQNEVADYFPLDGVIDGMFEITGEVFGLEYRKMENAMAWHEDVGLYEIYNAGGDEPIAYFYFDLFPRDGKYGHAACFDIMGRVRRQDGSVRPPIAAVVANFTKPGPDSPSLLKHDEALTLFHEFGHVLHFCLTEVDHPRFAGYDTEWDFVEAPSQIMENWMWEPEVLGRMARHYETGERIPDDLVKRMVDARDQNEGLTTLRQVYLGKFDLALHAGTEDLDIDETNREAFAYSLLPFHEGTHFAASFGHLMGGYDAGYYGYQWARVYGDDMFSVFAEEGVLSPEVGRRYRDEVLARGYSRDAIDHLRAFLGREPSADAYLEHLGLLR